MTATQKTNKQDVSPQLTQWYILRGEMKYGPYEYGIIIQMLQKGEVQDYNYVWAPHLSTWTLLGDVPDFAMDRLAGLIMNRDQKTHGFVIREFARVDHTIPLYGHNEHHFFDGESLSISENGALVLLNTPLLVPGSDLVMHFRTPNTEPFNVVAQVVRKNFSKTRINVKSGLHYAVRFLQVPERGLNTLKKLINESK